MTVPPERFYYDWSRSRQAPTTEYSEEKQFWYVVENQVARLQRWTIGGIAAGFLCRLHLAEPKPEYLELARRYQAFSMSATERQFDYGPVCKSGWGSSLLYLVTGEPAYEAWSYRMGDWFLKCQHPDGYWLTGKPIEQGQLIHNAFEFVMHVDTLFNAPGGGQLYVENLKGVTGEVALRLGAENEAFGVINVGDDAKLVKLCEKHGLATGEREFSGSLFHEINKPHSTVNLLIGSKKFTEGWSSWRVSTMGLMNVGKGKGAQIIQLFGRGVRLKGFDLSLKRSGKTDLPAGVDRSKYIGVLETLGIFGIHADYMAQFRDFLDEEGLPTNDDRIEFLLPVIKNLGTQKLKTIRIKKTINGVSTEFGDAFRKLAPVPTIAPPDPANDREYHYLQKNQVLLNWYPKIQAMKSGGLTGGDADAAPNETHLASRHVAFLDLDRICFNLERFKVERGWYNLNLTRQGIEGLLGDASWYRLQIPAEELVGNSYEKVRLWEEIAVALLKKYTERFYTFRKLEWELPHLEYRILIDKSQEEIVAKLEELKAAIQKGELKPWEFRGMKAIWFEKHLYQPLLYLDTNVVEISPAPLNKGEGQFVEDLKTFHDGHADFFKTRELYLLRNLSKGRGVGFFEAGNFHPDFILWLIEGGQQKVIFVDPKGIRNLLRNDLKIRFHETIKEIEQRLDDPAVRLQSFIVSNTPFATMHRQWGMEKSEMQRCHVLFQEEDKGQLRWDNAEWVATT